MMCLCAYIFSFSSPLSLKEGLLWVYNKKKGRKTMGISSQRFFCFFSLSYFFLVVVGGGGGGGDI
jgi:hypothetical protein